MNIRVYFYQGQGETTNINKGTEISNAQQEAKIKADAQKLEKASNDKTADGLKKELLRLRILGSCLPIFLQIKLIE